jgi:tRNA threonylcarbamoyladenosine biosynthesis protein TsaE
VTRREFLTVSPVETEELGRQIGALLERGAFVALRGDLGGGKTCFTRGVVAAAAPESAHLVASPTFAIMNHYPGPVPCYHFDFYRLSGEDEILDLGLEEYLWGGGICIAEWSERLGRLLPSDHLQITFEHAGDDRRRIIVEATGAESEKLLASLVGLADSENIL